MLGAALEGRFERALTPFIEFIIYILNKNFMKLDICHSINKTFGSQSCFSFYPDLFLYYLVNNNNTSYSLQSLVCVSRFHLPTRSLVVQIHITNLEENLTQNTDISISESWLLPVTLSYCVIIPIIIMEWLPYSLPQWKDFTFIHIFWKIHTYFSKYLCICKYQPSSSSSPTLKSI